MFYPIIIQNRKSHEENIKKDFRRTWNSGYIGIIDLTRAGDIIRSDTYAAFMPLIGVAIIYLVVVVILEAGVHKLEMRLRTNER